MYAKYIFSVMANFDIVMFGLAIVFIMLHGLARRGYVPEAEIVYRWMVLFAVGVTSIYAAMMHVFFPEVAAAAIGWQVSPFQYEVGMAGFGFGVMAILSFNANYSFRLATVIGLVCWLWGDASGHIYQMIVHQDFMLGNAGTWFWMDLVLPFILIICIFNLRPSVVGHE